MKHRDPRARVREFWQGLSNELSVRTWEHAEPLLDAFVEDLLGHAEARNLVAKSQRNAAAIWEHILDSAQILPLLGDTRGARLLDFGSGNGLPGLVLAVASPDCHITLLERMESTVEFLEFAISRLKTRNAHVYLSDAAAATILRFDPDILVNRAVPPRVIEKSLRLAHSGVRRSSSFQWVVFATDSNSAEWVDLAARLDYKLSSQAALDLPDKSYQRQYLKFVAV